MIHNETAIEKVTENQHSQPDQIKTEISCLEKNKSDISSSVKQESDIRNTIGEKASEILHGTEYFISDIKTAVIPNGGDISSSIDGFIKNVSDKFATTFDNVKLYVKNVNGECLVQDIKDKGQLYQGLKKLAITGGIVGTVFLASQVVPIPVAGMVLVACGKGAALGAASSALIDGCIGFAKSVKDGADINGAIKSFVDKGGSGSISGAVTGGIFGAASGASKISAFKAQEIASIAEKTGASSNEVAGILNAGKAATPEKVISTANSFKAMEKVDSALAKGKKLDTGDMLSFLDEVKDRINHTPKEGINGTWSGERGNSLFKPFENVLPKGIDGIKYKDGIPDFSKVAEASVKIDDMTGRRSYNFAQCDSKLAELWNLVGHEGKKSWTARDIAGFRKENGLTWHECIDRMTCQLVNSKIHSSATHVGGVSMCKAIESVGEVTGI